MRYVQIDAACLKVLLRDHDDDFRGLQEISRLHCVEHKAGDTYRPTPRPACVAWLSGKNALVAVAQFLSGPGLEDRAHQIGYRKCRLRTRSSRRGIGNVRMGWVVHNRTGPAQWRQELRSVGHPADFA